MSIEIKAMQAKVLLDLLGEYDPSFICVFCNQPISKISNISGVKKVKDGIRLTCNRPDCSHKAWGKATSLTKEVIGDTR